ncbi:unnamed protein product [Ectocarpus sp. 4 AP-2014]
MGSACSSQDASQEPGGGVTTSGYMMGQTQSGSASARHQGQFKKCQLPGCSNPVHVDPKSNKVFDHCCRGHAIQHQNPPQPASQSTADISDFQQPCLLPGCKLVGSVDKTTGVSYDYCSKAHANEAAMRMSGVAPKMDSTTPTIDHSGLRAPSSGGDTFLPQYKHSECTRPCAADAKTGRIHDVCQTDFSGAANSTTYIVAGRTSADSSTKAPARAAMGGTVGIIKISSFAQAAPPPPSASSASGRLTRPSAVSSGQCQLAGCAKLSAINTSTGERYDFCSRQHAQQAKNPGKSGPFNTGGAFSAVPGSAVCMLLGCVKPQAPGYDHCCKDHALAARKYIPMCTLRGCAKDAWFDPKRNQYSSYCGRAHRNEGERVLQEMTGGSGGSGFRLQELDRSHQKYESVKTQFTSKWQKGNVPKVENVFLIKMPMGVVDKYLAYKNRVGNERRRFHGTSRASDCDFFTGSKKRPCSSRTCVACNICMVGFKLVGTTRKSYARYGRGLYFSSVSGKSNDYADGSEQRRNGTRYRTMFLCNVAVGNAKVTEAVDLPDDQCPGKGFDSVVGNKGANLNFDETVVYDDAAAIPSYMIVYRM